MQESKEVIHLYRDKILKKISELNLHSDDLHGYVVERHVLQLLFCEFEDAVSDNEDVCARYKELFQSSAWNEVRNAFIDLRTRESVLFFDSIRLGEIFKITDEWLIDSNFDSRMHVSDENFWWLRKRFGCNLPFRDMYMSSYVMSKVTQTELFFMKKHINECKECSSLLEKANLHGKVLPKR